MEADAQAIAARLAALRLSSSAWQLDTEVPEEEFEEVPEPELELVPTPTPRFGVPAASVAPPPAVRILEALLFAGEVALTSATACQAIRGLTPDRFLGLIDELAKAYRKQNRPYTIQPRDGGYALELKPQFRDLKEKLFGGPKETRLQPPAIETLSLIAYRQPITKGEIDEQRGADSATPLRQLVRLGLAVVVRRANAENPAPHYGTTPRFLETFGMSSLDDLPRLGDS